MEIREELDLRPLYWKKGSTIRLSVFARRREIEIMKYVGATNSLVTLPFFVAVSYTHLDVYKRQVCSTGSCGCSRAGLGTE